MTGFEMEGEAYKELKEFISFMVMEGKEGDPLSITCKLALEKGLSKDVCYDFRGIRRWVLCKAWRHIEEEKVPFGEAIRRAWREAKEGCLKVGATI